MPIATLVLAGALTVVPKAPVLDFSKLPQPGGPDYQITIRLQLANRQVIELQQVGVGSAADPEDVLDAVIDALNDKKCNSRQEGLRLKVHGCAGVKITGVTITSTGPKPTVRWVLAPPA